MPNQKSECLTVSVETAAKWLGISRGLAYSMVHQKKIPALRFNRCIRIPKFALEKLLSGGERDIDEESPGGQGTGLAQR